MGSLEESYNNRGGETLKQVNYLYKKLYHNLSREYQKLITVKEYKEFISTRIFPCSQVSFAKVDILYKRLMKSWSVLKQWNRKFRTGMRAPNQKRRRNLKKKKKLLRLPKPETFSLLRATEITNKEIMKLNENFTSTRKFTSSRKSKGNNAYNKNIQKKKKLILVGKGCIY